MSDFITISCIIDTTNPTTNLGFEAWVDDRKFFDSKHIENSQKISVEVNNDDADHELRFILKNKTAEHTQVDESGKIIKDANLTIKDLAFDDIKLGHLFVKESVYIHDFNGAGPETKQQFFGEMGCNGTVSLKFATPMYLWILERM